MAVMRSLLAIVLLIGIFNAVPVVSLHKRKYYRPAVPFHSQVLPVPRAPYHQQHQSFHYPRPQQAYSAPSAFKQQQSPSAIQKAPNPVPQIASRPIVIYGVGPHQSPPVIQNNYAGLANLMNKFNPLLAYGLPGTPIIPSPLPNGTKWATAAPSKPTDNPLTTLAGGQPSADKNLGATASSSVKPTTATTGYQSSAGPTATIQPSKYSSVHVPPTAPISTVETASITTGPPLTLPLISTAPTVTQPTHQSIPPVSTAPPVSIKATYPSIPASPSAPSSTKWQQETTTGPSSTESTPLPTFPTVLLTFPPSNSPPITNTFPPFIPIPTTTAPPPIQIDLIDPEAEELQTRPPPFSQAANGNYPPKPAAVSSSSSSFPTIPEDLRSPEPLSATEPNNEQSATFPGFSSIVTDGQFNNQWPSSIQSDLESPTGPPDGFNQWLSSTPNSNFFGPTEESIKWPSSLTSFESFQSNSEPSINSPSTMDPFIEELLRPATPIPPPILESDSLVSPSFRPEGSTVPVVDPSTQKPRPSYTRPNGYKPRPFNRPSILSTTESSVEAPAITTHRIYTTKTTRAPISNRPKPNPYYKTTPASLASTIRTSTYTAPPTEPSIIPVEITQPSVIDPEPPTTIRNTFFKPRPMTVPPVTEPPESLFSPTTVPENEPFEIQKIHNNNKPTEPPKSMYQRPPFPVEVFQAIAPVQPPPATYFNTAPQQAAQIIEQPIQTPPQAAYFNTVPKQTALIIEQPIETPPPKYSNTAPPQTFFNTNNNQPSSSEKYPAQFYQSQSSSKPPPPPPPPPPPKPYKSPAAPQFPTYLAQHSYGQQQHNHHDEDGDLSAIPGEPGVDYPIFHEPPQSSFKCSDQRLPGYYADVSARCQMFHVCWENRQWSFLCPNGTIFSQQHFVCVWWHQFDCNDATALYDLNAKLYIVPPKLYAQPSPSDYYSKQSRTLDVSGGENLVETKINNVTLSPDNKDIKLSYFSELKGEENVGGLLDISTVIYSIEDDEITPSSDFESVKEIVNNKTSEVTTLATVSYTLEPELSTTTTTISTAIVVPESTPYSVDLLSTTT